MSREASGNPGSSAPLRAHGPVALPLAILGVVLVLIGTGWSIAFGAAALLIACIPGVIGLGLLVPALVARWSARHRSFA